MEISKIVTKLQMFFYITLAVWLSLCALIGRKFRDLIWFNIFLLSLINGLRHVQIGIDTANYYDIWEWINEGGGEFIEPAWYLLNKSIQCMGGGYNLLLWIVALMTFIPIGYTAKKYTNNPSLTLLFYFFITFYLQSLNIMRQILTVSLVLIGYDFLLQDKKLKYIKYTCITLIACTFHTSAICSFFVLIANKIKLSIKIIIFLFGASLCVSFILNPQFISLFIGDYAVYIQNGAGIREDILSAYILGILVNSFYVLLFATIKKEYQNTWFMKVYFLGIILMNLTTQLELGTRIILYYTIAQIFIYPLYLENNRFKHKFIAPLLLFTYAIVLFFKLLNGDPLQICPYRPYFI